LKLVKGNSLVSLVAKKEIRKAEYPARSTTAVKYDVRNTTRQDNVRGVTLRPETPKFASARTRNSMAVTNKLAITNMSFMSDFTKRRGRVVNTPASYSGGVRFKSRAKDWLSGLRIFVGFLSPSRLIVEYEPKIRPRPILSKSLPIHHSLINM
jgi:hypothetical protein